MFWVDYGEYLVFVSWLDEGSLSSSHDEETGDLVTLFVDYLAGLVGGLVEVLSDESEQPSVFQLFKCLVFVESCAVHRHGHSDSQLGTQALDEIDKPICGLLVVV